MLPKDWSWVELDFSVSHSFSQFRGVVERMVFFFLNSVFLPRTAFSNETPSTEEQPPPPLKCHSCFRASWNSAKGTVIAVGRGMNSECEVNHREGGALPPLLDALRWEHQPFGLMWALFITPCYLFQFSAAASFSLGAIETMIFLFYNSSGGEFGSLWILGLYLLRASHSRPSWQVQLCENRGIMFA